MMNTLRILYALIWRDLLGLLRRPSRVMAVVGTPLLVWGFMATGFGHSDVLAEGESFTGYLLPGIAILLVVLSAMVGAISLIQDRHDGILPALLVSPADRVILSTARILSASLIAMLQALIIIPLVPLTGGTLTIPGLAVAVLVLMLVSIAISGVSLAMAWKIDSIAGFHGVMNLVLMPMWLVSGSIAPSTTSIAGLDFIIRWNPLGAAGGLLRGALGLAEPRTDAVAWVLLIAVAAGGFGVAMRVFGRGDSSSPAKGG